MSSSAEAPSASSQPAVEDTTTDLQDAPAQNFVPPAPVVEPAERVPAYIPPSPQDIIDVRKMMREQHDIPESPTVVNESYPAFVANTNRLVADASSSSNAAPVVHRSVADWAADTRPRPPKLEFYVVHCLRRNGVMQRMSLRPSTAELSILRSDEDSRQETRERKLLRKPRTPPVTGAPQQVQAALEELTPVISQLLKQKRDLEIEHCKAIQAYEDEFDKPSSAYEGLYDHIPGAITVEQIYANRTGIEQAGLMKLASYERYKRDSLALLENICQVLEGAMAGMPETHREDLELLLEKLGMTTAPDLKKPQQQQSAAPSGTRQSARSGGLNTQRMEEKTPVKLDLKRKRSSDDEDGEARTKVRKSKLTVSVPGIDANAEAGTSKRKRSAGEDGEASGVAKKSKLMGSERLSDATTGSGTSIDQMHMKAPPAANNHAQQADMWSKIGRPYRYLQSCPAVIDTNHTDPNERYALLGCKICEGNTSYGNPTEFFKGAIGLHQHYKTTHPDDPLSQAKIAAVVPTCVIQYLSTDMVEMIALGTLEIDKKPTWCPSRKDQWEAKQAVPMTITSEARQQTEAMSSEPNSTGTDASGVGEPALPQGNLTVPSPANVARAVSEQMPEENMG